MERAILGRDGDRRPVAVGFERRIHVMRQQGEQPDVRGGRNQAPRENELEPTNAIGERAEYDEEGSADEKREADERVRGLVIHL